MFRRVVSLLLVPCMLLTQSAALLGHIHADLRLPGHDLRPHFHTQPVPAGHDRVRGDDHGHHHEPGDFHRHDEVPTAQTPATPDPEPQPDHDSDAVYVNAVDVVANVRCVFDDGDDALAFWATTAASNVVGLWPNPARPSANWRPPPPAGGSCPLYLRHLTLLI